MSASPKVIHVTTTVQKKGIITLENLPLQVGERVEIVIYETSSSPESTYPLRGKPVQYDAPFDSVAETDWDILR